MYVLPICSLIFGETDGILENYCMLAPHSLQLNVLNYSSSYIFQLDSFTHMYIVIVFFTILILLWRQRQSSVNMGKIFQILF